MSGEHIVKAFDDDLRKIDALVAQIGGLAEAQISAAIQAVAKRDSAIANMVIEGDGKVDMLREQLDEQAVRLLALRQPVAVDLRVIVAALRIAGDLERIADYAANMAKRSIALNQAPVVKPVAAIPRMGTMVQRLIKDVLDAYVSRDAEKAMDVWRRDEEVDEMYNSLFRELLTYMMEDPRSIGVCTHLLFMAKNIERMGDHTTNVAELIYYMVNGRKMAGVRPKGDTTSYAVAG